MPPHELIALERSQCIRRAAKGNTETAIKRKFRIKRFNMAPNHGTITIWIQDSTSRGYHDHRGGNTRPQINEILKASFRDIIKQDPKNFLGMWLVKFDSIT